MGGAPISLEFKQKAAGSVVDVAEKWRYNGISEVPKAGDAGMPDPYLEVIPYRLIFSDVLPIVVKPF